MNQLKTQKQNICIIEVLRLSNIHDTYLGTAKVKKIKICQEKLWNQYRVKKLSVNCLEKKEKKIKLYWISQNHI